MQRFISSQKAALINTTKRGYQKVLTKETIPTGVVEADFAVKGALVIRGEQITKEI